LKKKRKKEQDIQLIYNVKSVVLCFCLPCLDCTIPE